MKRRSESEVSLRHLKRSNSSVFSIATIVEQDSTVRNVDVEPVVGAIRMTPPHPPRAAAAHPSEADGGFYVESGGGDGNDNDGDERTDTSTLDTSSYLPVLSPSRKTKKKETRVANDNVTGVIFESSDGHCDRSNRLHKERPLRIVSIKDHLIRPECHHISRRCKIFGDAGAVYKREEGNTGGTIGTMAATEATVDQFLDDEDYLRVHLAGYMQRLDRLSGCACTDRLDCEAEQFKSIYLAPATVECAKNAASSFCRLVSDVVTGKLDNAFAIIRPPGHHAEPSLAGGYCVLNNVALAATYAREKLGVAKILIVDWDIHHGNGTQSAFINDADVLYFSVHRYHNGNYFPFLGGNGGPDMVGEGKGAGFNINVGWNQKHMGDEEYYAVWKRALMPIAREFQPKLILVSAGFDGALGDMGECNITPQCYGELTKQLMTLAEGKVVCTLEGGYVRSILAKCCEAVILALLTGDKGRNANDCSTNEYEDCRTNHFCDAGDEEKKQVDSSDKPSCISSTEEKDKGNLLHVDLPAVSINPSAEKSIRATIAAHAIYWKCLSTKSLEGLDDAADE